MPAVESRVLSDEGGSIFCEVVGTGRPVVFSHDAMLHGQTWDAQFAGLRAAGRLIRWDRRGYGRSDVPTASYSSAADLARVIASVAEPPAVLIGCSYGSLLSLHCALEHPELVSGLILVGPIVSGLGFTEHFTTRGGRYRGEETDL